MENYFEKKENVIEWFGERGVTLSSEPIEKGLYLDKYKWINRKLFFVIKGKQFDGYSGISRTEVGKIDMCYTNRKDGSMLDIYELCTSYQTTFEELDLIVKKVEQREDLEEKQQHEFEILKQRQNEELINIIEKNDILIKNEGMSNVQFFQVIDVDKTIHQIKIKELQKYCFGQSNIGMDYIVSYELNEFEDDAKEIILNKKSSIPSIFKEKTALEYGGN